jgi:hypothetical protein
LSIRNAQPGLMVEVALPIPARAGAMTGEMRDQV